MSCLPAGLRIGFPPFEWLPTPVINIHDVGLGLLLGELAIFSYLRLKPLLYSTMSMLAFAYLIVKPCKSHTSAPSCSSTLAHAKKGERKHEFDHSNSN